MISSYCRRSRVRYLSFRFVSYRSTGFGSRSGQRYGMDRFQALRLREISNLDPAALTLLGNAALRKEKGALWIANTRALGVFLRDKPHVRGTVEPDCPKRTNRPTKCCARVLSDLFPQSKPTHFAYSCVNARSKDAVHDTLHFFGLLL